VVGRRVEVRQLAALVNRLAEARIAHAEVDRQVRLPAEIVLGVELVLTRADVGRQVLVGLREGRDVAEQEIRPRLLGGGDLLAVYRRRARRGGEQERADVV